VDDEVEVRGWRTAAPDAISCGGAPQAPSPAISCGGACRHHSTRDGGHRANNYIMFSNSSALEFVRAVSQPTGVGPSY
jgi:hypothetical protein